MLGLILTWGPLRQTIVFCIYLTVKAILVIADKPLLETMSFVFSRVRESVCIASSSPCCSRSTTKLCLNSRNICSGSTRGIFGPAASPAIFCSSYLLRPSGWRMVVRRGFANMLRVAVILPDMGDEFSAALISGLESCLTRNNSYFIVSYRGIPEMLGENRYFAGSRC